MAIDSFTFVQMHENTEWSAKQVHMNHSDYATFGTLVWYEGKSISKLQMDTELKQTRVLI
jgi:hypothetical protein